MRCSGQREEARQAAAAQWSRVCLALTSDSSFEWPQARRQGALRAQREGRNHHSDRSGGSRGARRMVSDAAVLCCCVPSQVSPRVEWGLRSARRDHAERPEQHTTPSHHPLASERLHAHPLLPLLAPVASLPPPFRAVSAASTAPVGFHAARIWVERTQQQSTPTSVGRAASCPPSASSPALVRTTRAVLGVCPPRRLPSASRAEPHTRGSVGLLSLPPVEPHTWLAQVMPPADPH